MTTSHDKSADQPPEQFSAIEDARRTIKQSIFATVM